VVLQALAAEVKATDDFLIPPQLHEGECKGDMESCTPLQCTRTVEQATCCIGTTRVQGVACPSGLPLWRMCLLRVAACTALHLPRLASVELQILKKSPADGHAHPDI